MTHQEYIDSIRASALNFGKEAVINYIKSKAPFFLIPVLNPITSLIVSKILEILLKETEFAAFFYYIDTRTSHQGELFAQMAYRNYIAQQFGSEIEKKIAQENLENAFKTLVKFAS